MNRLLEVVDLSFAYPTKKIFDRISFDMHQGDVLCLMGPNGCGKTTLLDNIMSVHQPTAGEIHLSGKSLTKYRRKEVAHKIAYVPQIHQVVFPYTVEQIVLMGRTAHVGFFGEPGDHDELLAKEALELVGITDLSKKPYSQLSGGEIKLVLLARALSQKAPLLVMDEPTANLDFKNELVFLETVVRLNRKDHIAVLLATHSPEHAFYFQAKGCNVHAMMMNHGSMVAQGSPEVVITEENIKAVYGVKSRIREEMDTDGTPVRSITLLGTA